MESLPSSLTPFIFQTVAIALTTFLLPKLKITSIFGAIGMVVGLSLVNHYLWASDLFTALPNSLSAKSIVLFFSNGVIFFALVKFLPGIEVEGLFTALIAPILFSVLTVLIQKYAPLVDWGQVFQSLIDFIISLKSYILGQQHSAPPSMIGKPSSRPDLLSY